MFIEVVGRPHAGNGRGGGKCRGKLGRRGGR